MTVKATLISVTTFLPGGVDIPWKENPEDPPEQSLIEFAGRSCYQSWERPNPKTATSDGYIQNILDMAHYSVLEHANAGFYIEGVSRSLTHELVRHRHFSYSQLSQRYVDSSQTEYVVPPEAEGDETLEQLLWAAFDRQLDTYNAVVDHLMQKFLTEGGTSPVEMRKRARQTARSVLGNFTETKIVMTGNYRAWRHFVHMRASTAADPEIRRLAILILIQLQNTAPAVFEDFRIIPYGDTHVAISDRRDEDA